MLPQLFLGCLMFASLLSLIGCRGSTKELPASVADTGLELHVEHITDRRDGAPFEINRIIAVVRDKKGAAIENEGLRVYVNKLPMRFHVWSGNYYDRHPSYRLEEQDNFAVKPDTSYEVELGWPDGKRHRVAQVSSPGALAAKQFDVPRQHPRSRDLVITWKDVETAAELVAQWTPVPLSDNGEIGEDGKPLVDEQRREKLGRGWFRSRSGRLTVPASAFATRDGRRPTEVAITIRAENQGQLEGIKATKSQVSAVRLITFHVELTE